jgi:uncharacterized protein YbjT (DUF2867 family)
MSIENVLVIGATGALGSHMPDALRERGKTVHALVRPQTLAANGDSGKRVDHLRAQGVRLHAGDLEDPESLLAACREVDAVISCVGGEQVPLQAGLLEAMKEAGTIQRFIPSEYGTDARLAEPGSCGLYDIKANVRDLVAASEIPHTFIYANGFMNYWAGGLGELGKLRPPEVLTVYGDGLHAAHVATIPNVAAYIARALDDARTENAHMTIQIPDNRVTQADMVTLWREKSGRNVETQQLTTDALDALIAKAGESGDIMTTMYLQLARSVWVRGELDRTYEGTLQATELYPGVQPTTVGQVYDAFLTER